MALCIVRGSGDVGSAVAHALYAAGFAVLIHDQQAPPHPRRGMAFVDAIFEGCTKLDSVLAKRSTCLRNLPYMIRCARAIPVATDKITGVFGELRPDILVDARMRKRKKPESQRGLAALTIGLGPGFVAGETVDVVIETAWGEALGHRIQQGSATPLSGEPCILGGHGRDRYVYAPSAGEFQTSRAIGEMVAAGDTLLGNTTLVAPLSGCMRGLTHHGVWVERGTKVIEIDPRGDPALAFRIGERPKRIAEGVLAAIG